MTSTSRDRERKKDRKERAPNCPVCGRFMAIRGLIQPYTCETMAYKCSQLVYTVDGWKHL